MLEVVVIVIFISEYKFFVMFFLYFDWICIENEDILIFLDEWGKVSELI